MLGKQPVECDHLRARSGPVLTVTMGNRGMLQCQGCSTYSLWTCVPASSFFATLWTVAHQAPLSMRFFRQEYWSGLSCPPPGSLPYPVIKSGSPTLQVDSLPSEPPGKPNGFQSFLNYFFVIFGSAESSLLHSSFYLVAANRDHSSL